MAQYIKQADIFGRIGSGIGAGLAEQLPKEIERGRLSAGLEKLGQQGGLSPFQQFAGLAAVPGITPQMIQSGTELLRQQAKAQALNEFRERDLERNQRSPFPNVQSGEINQPSVGLTTRPGIEATRRGYIPPSYNQILSRASELYNQNRGLYPDPQLAIQAATQEAAQEQAINQAYQAQRQGEKVVQQDIKKGLEGRKNQLAANNVPPDVYTQLEQDAVKSVLPREAGGEGLTDEEAITKYGNQADEISRQYTSLSGLGDYTLPFKKNPLQAIESVRKEFKRRGDLRNFADYLVSQNGLSPSKAYYIAYPSSDFPGVDKILKKIPDVKTKIPDILGGKTPVGQYLAEKENPWVPEKILEQITPTLAKEMGKDASPLSIAESLQAKGYDPSYFLKYLDENRDSLDLTKRQLDELTKSRNFIPNLNDLWIFGITGQQNLVE